MPFRRKNPLITGSKLGIGLFVIFLLASAHVYAQAPGTIQTVAGTGERSETSCPSGSDCPPTYRIGMRATGWYLGEVRGVGTDVLGNLYIVSDSEGIAKVAPDGTLTFAAGVPPCLFTGEGCPDRDRVADIYPADQVWGKYMGLTFDSDGSLYFSDLLQMRIYRLKPGDDEVTRFAGNNPHSSDGTVTGGFSGDGGSALEARFNIPSGLAADADGNLYVNDFENRRIRMIDSEGNISTVAGNGQIGGGQDLELEEGDSARSLAIDFAPLTVDADGNIVAATLNRILKIWHDGTVHVLAGRNFFGQEYSEEDGMTGAETTIQNPSAVAVDLTGNVFYADMFRHLVRKITPDGLVFTVAGRGPHHTIPQGEPNAGHEVGLDTGDSGPAVLAYLNEPQALAIDLNGNLYIGEQGGRRVRVVYGVAGPGLIGGTPLPVSGDVNRDQSIDIADAVLILRSSVGLAALTPEQKVFADMDRSGGSPDVTDAVLVLRKILGL